MDNKIAIIGLSCRLPGDIKSLDDYWRVLKNGIDTITEIPDSRWDKAIYGHPTPKVRGKSYIWAAGVLEDVESFDADFFGISRREAEQIDPQQRLLLELVWEAFESGGLKPSDYRGSKSGVFIGVGSNDYAIRRIDDLASMNSYSMTGNTASICSNRISYIFDWHGPSFSIDTACSSSLIAIHQACQSLKNGEATLAVAGGVNMLLHPMGFVGFSQASMLSPTGRCKAFDASADGYVRSEGAGVVILKPLIEALKDGNQIFAIINASAINADGKKNGISLPNITAQTALLNTIYQNFDVNDLAYFEAHGTGTSVGDPIEAGAISNAITKKRDPNNPLVIGSAKTNLGHLEVASGMAGLLKAILCLKHRAIPASIHYQTPNHNIPFEDWNLQVATQYTTIKTTDKPIFIGVNSFGFGGANAHILLEEYKVSSRTRAVKNLTPPLIISANTEDGLITLAEQMVELLRFQQSNYYDLAWSAYHYRSLYKERISVYGATSQDIANSLEDYIANKQSEGVTKVTVTRQNSNKIALIYSGNGSQWAGMGVKLLQESDLFRQTIEEVDQLWQKLADFSILEELLQPIEKSKLELTEVAQPLLFAVQVGISKILIDQGVIISAVAGHSVGEVAAAWFSGALSLEQAVKVIFERSYAQGKTRGSGKMAAVMLPKRKMNEYLERYGFLSEIVVAGDNSPKAVTIAGNTDALLVLKEVLVKDGVIFKLLDLDYAFHSDHMDHIKDLITQKLSELIPSKTKIDYISTVTGSQLSGKKLTSDYWWHNIRDQVRFNDAIDYLIEQDIGLFIEIGPHSILSKYVEQCCNEKLSSSVVLTTLQKNNDSLELINKCFYSVLLHQGNINYKKLFPVKGSFISLPRYPWAKEKFWVQPLNQHSLIERRVQYPLLGYKDGDKLAWIGALDTKLISWIADHVVGGSVVVPAAAYVDMVLCAAQAIYNHDNLSFEDMEVYSPITLDAQEIKKITTTIGENQTIIINSDDNKINNVAARIIENTAIPSLYHNLYDLETAEQMFTAEKHYQLAIKVGLEYGGYFQTIEKVWVWKQHNYAIAKLKLEGSLNSNVSAHLLHPTLLDGCFQVLLDIFSDRIESGDLRALIPIRIGKILFFRNENQPVWCSVEVTNETERSGVANFTLFDKNNQITARLNAVRFRSVNFVNVKETSYSKYTYELKLAPINNYTSGVIGIEALRDFIDKNFNSTEKRRRISFFQEVLPLMEALVCSYYLKYIKILVGNRTQFACSNLIMDYGVDKRYLPLVSHIVKSLEENKFIEKNSDGLYNLTNSELPEPDLIWRTMIGDFPECLPELSILATLGESLPQIINGNIKAESFFNPQKSSTLSHYYGGSSTFEWQSHKLSILMQSLVTTVKPGSRLKILDLSSRYSEISKILMPSLKNQSCDYILAHEDEDYISDMITEMDGFENFKAFQVNQENLEQDIIQKSQNKYFDIILINNNFHKSVNFSRMLKSITNLLKFNGKLIIGEENNNAFNSLFYGVEPDWWLNSNENNYTPRLFDSASWEQLFIDNGLRNIVTLNEQEDILHQGPYVIITEKVTSATDPELKEAVSTTKTALIITDGDPLTQKLYNQIVSLLPTFKCINLENTSICQKLTENHYKINLSQEETFVQVLDEISDFQMIIDINGFTSNIANQSLCSVDQEYRCVNTLALIRSLEPRIQKEQITLWIVTNNGAVFNDANQKCSNNPADSALWGLGRVAMNEYPELETKLLDLRNFELDTELIAGAIAGEITHIAQDHETEIVHYPGARFVMRMRDNQPQGNDRDIAEIDHGYELSFKVPGSLSNLYWKTKEYKHINSDEIRIKPYATGVNFRDVMYAMGMISDEAVENGYAGATLGMELSGVVEEIGSDVTAFKVGDEVISFAPAGFSNSVVTKIIATALKPKEWSHEEAATIPTVFFTVYYALHHLAHLQPGEKILIHGAAGGIGLAALQYASYIGAEIYATASTDEKRAFVKAMGANYVFDSRSLAFADKIMDLTKGSGVDVVLNSLYGEAVWRSLAVLKPFGRFLELGKRDFYANNKLGLRPFRNNISYFGIDADQLMIEKPQLATKLFKEMMELFNLNVFKPLPFRIFPVNKIEHAFRYMQQSRQIGKVIVSMENLQSSVKINLGNKLTGKLVLDSQASYVVTGGTGGFGLAAARWLVSKGAKNLLLLSRNGIKDTESAQTIENLREQGINIYIHNLDISDYSKLELFFKHANENYPIIKGVIHAAAVINDAFIRDTDNELFNKVFYPKAYGARNLHNLTKSFPLDFFVVFSSMTTYIGNPGQASYVAANSYLEGLIHYRRTNGLKGTYVAFGAISDAGFLTRNKAVKDSLESKLGSDAISATCALHEMEQLILQDIAGAAVVNFEWNNLKKYLPTAKSPKHEQQLIKASKLDTDNTDVDIKKMIMALSKEEAIEVVGKLLAHEIGKILHLAPEKIDANKSIFELGMDSLMGVELAMSVEQHFAFKLPLMALADGATINKLAAFIYDKTCNHSQVNDESEVQDIAQSLAVKHGVDIEQEKL